ISDVMGTSGVLLSTVLSPILHFNLDGYMGVIVACFILMTGASVIKNALNELLGKAPDATLVKAIQEKIASYAGVLGIHDLMIHDYGAHRTFASVHVEVDCKVDVLISHDMIDNIERDFKENMDLEMVIHMDPIDTKDPLTNELRSYMKKAVKEINEDLTLHDFRVVPGETHTNMIFDVVVPFHIKLNNQQLIDMLEEKIKERKEDTYYLVVTFDRAYTSESKEEHDE
ncbi:MAG: cation transporter dimerization domain-containing protein, partial [Longicatena sp.]